MNKNKFYKLLLIAGILGGSCMAKADETCADGMGTLRLGKDNTTYYCTSNITMNWWSAFAWCKSIGGTLFDVNTECSKTSGIQECPQVNALEMDAWTVNIVDEETAVVINGWGGGWSSRIYSEKKTNNKKATCVMP